MNRSRSRGFTFLELLFAVIAAALAAHLIVVYAGRKIVDDSDGLRVAKAAGLLNPTLVERHNWLARFRGCTKEDAVIMKVAGKDAADAEVEMTICCGSWFKGCHAAKAE